MNTPFNKSFCGKSPLNELNARQEANLPEALKTAIEAKSPANYGSPLNQEADRTKYQDSIQKLHKPKYDDYVKKQTEGYIEDNTEDGMGTTFIPPATNPTSLKSLKEFAYAMEIGKGGSVTKDGVAASKLARMYQ